MPVESVFILNDIEKQAAEDLVLKLASGSVPAKQRTNNTNDIKSEISYEYYSTKQEKFIRGVILDCPYKLRYRDNNRIFFSAWDCKDVCGVFYDVMAIIRVMTKLNFHINEVYREFEVDLNLEEYVFYTGQIAGSFVDIADFLSTNSNKVSYNSQYILSVFAESDNSVYAALIQKLKADGYSYIRILQVWIRGEILYYALADGAVLRSGRQRPLNSKEEQDLIRKIHKDTNKLSRPFEFNPPSGTSGNKKNGT
ncbi:MAG: hypothetical protein LBE14_08410 [Treponema sp.]|jgi:hypothetical protein|nr:hypothetical protein [Treponema sp.]